MPNFQDVNAANAFAGGLTQGLGLVERMDALKTAAVARKRVELEMEHLPRKLDAELRAMEATTRARQFETELLTRFGEETAVHNAQLAQLRVENERTRQKIERQELANNTLAASRQAEYDGVVADIAAADVGDPAGMLLSAAEFQSRFAGNTNPLINGEIRKLRASALQTVGKELVAFQDLDGTTKHREVPVPFNKVLAMGRYDYDAAANKAFDIWGIDRDKFAKVMTQVEAEQGRAFSPPEGRGSLKDRIKGEVEEGRGGKGGAPATGPAPLDEKGALIFYGQGKVDELKSRAEAEPIATRAKALSKDPGALVAKLSELPDIRPGEGQVVAKDLAKLNDLIRGGKTVGEAKEIIRRSALLPPGAAVAMGGPAGYYQGLSAKANSEADRRLSLLDAVLKSE